MVVFYMCIKLFYQSLIKVWIVFYQFFGLTDGECSFDLNESGKVIIQ